MENTTFAELLQKNLIEPIKQKFATMTSRMRENNEENEKKINLLVQDFSEAISGANNTISSLVEQLAEANKKIDQLRIELDAVKSRQNESLKALSDINWEE